MVAMVSYPLWCLLLFVTYSLKVTDSKSVIKAIAKGVKDCILNNYTPPKPDDVQFYLYTRNIIDSPEVLRLPQEWQLESSENNQQQFKSTASFEQIRQKLKSVEFLPLDVTKSIIQSRLFNVLAQTKVLIHGYNQSSQSGALQRMKNAYLAKGDYNVIVVDWHVQSRSSCYPRVIKALPGVGRLVANFLDLLVEGGASPKIIHVVGFSLGAHIAGYTGAFNKEKVSRITGLDPASPLIKSDSTKSLDPKDADLVDIIHTSIDFYGKGKPMGHVDFYPNGGKKQPGCSKSSLNGCSHGRAVEYFIESINPSLEFPAAKCSSWHQLVNRECFSTGRRVLMGDPCPNGTDGIYFLTTRDVTPFGQETTSFGNTTLTE